LTFQGRPSQLSGIGCTVNASKKNEKKGGEERKIWRAACYCHCWTNEQMKEKGSESKKFKAKACS
jgi:hypothetical protein